MGRKTRVRRVIIRLLIASGAVLCSQGQVKADFTFGTPVKLGPTVNGAGNEAEPVISPDGLRLYFASGRAGGYGAWDIWVTTRETTDDDWGTPVNPGGTVNSGSHDIPTGISGDGLSLYLTSNRAGGQGGFDVWVATQETPAGQWDAAVNLGPVINSAGTDLACISSDGLELFISSDRPGGYGSLDLWVSTRAAAGDAWQAPANLGPTVNASSGEVYSSISSDGLALFFSEGDYPARVGGFGGSDIWVTRRIDRDADWGTPVNLGSNVNSSSFERGPSILADASILYFCSYQDSGQSDLWQAPILPVVDISDDGIVDMRDFALLARHWQENEPSVDMAPNPLGDGIVDMFEVQVLADHWMEESRLIAHWKLDETGGTAAQDSVGSHDGLLVNGPQWQVGGGVVDGGLGFDGIDDYVYVPFVLNPRDGAFSVFMWVKGGGAGQVMMSQIDTTGAGKAWLCCDGAEGKLMTELQDPGRGGYPLISEVVIGDGQWHRVGLVWDGSYRSLYVDDEEVAVDADPQASLDSLRSVMFIGAGNKLSPGSHFNGMLDDIRIYNRAVKP